MWRSPNSSKVQHPVSIIGSGDPFLGCFQPKGIFKINISMLYFYCCKSSFGPLWICQSLILKKYVAAWYNPIYPYISSLHRVFFIRLPCSSAAFCSSAETCSLAWVCISPVKKTDDRSRPTFFIFLTPALEIFIQPLCYSKCFLILRKWQETMSFQPLLRL